MYKMTEKKEFKSLEYSPRYIKYRGNTKNQTSLASNDFNPENYL